MLIEPPNLTSSDTTAFFTTRNFFDNNNTIKEVLVNNFNISKDNIYLPVQKHTNKIHLLESNSEPEIADAVVTKRKNVFIGVLVADCVPVLLCDSNKGVIGAVHAGWRGTAKGILKNTIIAMQENFNCAARDILIALGPSIRKCSYEVGRDVQREVKRATGEGDYYSKREDGYFIDLSSANKIQALMEGISEDNIWQSDDCTFCNPHKYYSYRYSSGSTGRQGGFIGMW